MKLLAISDTVNTLGTDEMNGVLGHDSALERLHWAVDNLS